ncbi:hypothetical protein SOL79_09620 [Streptococcus sp. VEG1o]|nr:MULTISPECIES: hypothetical protein [unclassified Streptococcus]
MIEELEQCEDKKDFNYLSFMKKYHLRTVADEVMVIAEYQNLINH